MKGMCERCKVVFECDKVIHICEKMKKKSIKEEIINEKRKKKASKK
jgi:hypothetical protein